MITMPGMPPPAATSTGPDIQLYQHETDETWLARIAYNGIFTHATGPTRQDAYDKLHDWWQHHTAEGKRHGDG